MITPEVHFTKIASDAKMPYKATINSSGFDVYTQFKESLPTGEVIRINTGLKIDYITPGFELQVRPRSSFGARGIIMPNSPGTIDNSYRDELIVLLLNLSVHEYEIDKHERVAQIVFAPVQDARIIDTTNGGYVVAQHASTIRTGGFGSTGKK